MTLHIDWFTVVAQIVNFLILVAILYHFLFKKIIQAMDQRQNRIAEKVRKTEAEKEKATEERKDWQRKNREFQKEKEQMYENAESQVAKQKEKWLEETRTEMQKKKELWLEDIKDQQQQFYRRLQNRVGEKTVDITKQLVQELADQALERQVIEKFLRQLRSMAQSQKKLLLEGYQEKKEESLHIFSAFEISSDDREKILHEIGAILKKTPQVEFSIDPELVMGITLKCHGLKIGWSAQEFLHQLQEEFSQLMKNPEE